MRAMPEIPPPPRIPASRRLPTTREYAYGRSNTLLFTQLALRAIGSLEWTVVALQETGGVESRNLACVVLAQRGHRKRLRDGSAVLDLVRQRFGEGQPAERPRGHVPDDVHPRHTGLEGRVHLRAPVRELRRPRCAVLREHQPPVFQVTPARGTMLYEVRADRALHLFVSGDQAARVRLQTLAQKCGRPTHATEIARVELANVIVGRRRCRAVRGGHGRQQ